MPPALRQHGCIALGASREPRARWLGLRNGRPAPRPTRGGAHPTRAQVRPPLEGGEGRAGCSELRAAGAACPGAARGWGAVCGVRCGGSRKEGASGERKER